MYVCLCHGITESQIEEAVAQGATCLKDLRTRLRVTTSCGKCASCARQCLKHSMASPADDCGSNLVLSLAEAS